ncbi:hypothetical protein HPB48_015344 [Haemaphysalis longicornis]|uniref:Uncharacterized protein n=1 Tax=Haemaphysalis longicornis TaxID=44386 RepID=A0A9J6GTQ9_HAELO|nr:hypothetical protein HPB48_015344 [Haemaphysalis longicornis]
MFALVRFVSDLDKRPHVIPVSDIEALHPTHETDFDGKALYVAFWRDPAGKASGSYSVQVLMLAGRVTTHDASRGRRASRGESQHLRSRSRDVSRESIRGNNGGGQKQSAQLRAGVSWAAAAQDNGKTAANGFKNDQGYEQLRRANDQLRATNEKQRATIEMLAKRLAEVERRLGYQQSQPQGQQPWHQGQTRPADAEVVAPAQQKQVQQQRKAEQHQKKAVASQQLPMEVAGDEEEEEASEAPKKKPRKSTKVNLEASSRN